MKALAAWLGLCAVLLAHDALAHAVLVETAPPADTRLATAPERVLLRFSEPVVPISLQVLGPGRRPLDLPAVEAEGTDLGVQLPPNLADGAYLVSYRVRSADTHPVGGSFVFTVGEAAGGFEGAAPESHDRLWRWTGLGLRTLLYACLLAVAGSQLMAWLLRPPREVAAATVAPFRTLAWLGLATQIAVLGAAGAALAGGPPGSLLTGQPWQLALRSPLGLSALAALLGLLALLWGDRAKAGRAGLQVGGGLLITLSFALSGHAETAASRWLTVPVIWLHATCAAFWVGSLWPLLTALRRPADEAAALLALFSRYATAAVGLLIAVGTILTFLQLRSPTDLVATVYGQRLAAKLVAVMLMLGLAGINRYQLTPALLTQGAWARRWLRTTLCLDLALALVVVGLTAALGLDPPPRALAHAHRADQPRADYAIQATADGVTLVAVLAPARAGSNRLTLYATDRQGQPLRPKEVEARLALPAQGIEPLVRRVAGRADGSFVIDDLQLPVAGTWNLRVDLLIDDFTKVIVHARLRVKDDGP